MRRKYYYWIVAHDEVGKPYLIFGCPAHEGEDAARQKAFEMLPGSDFTICRYPTRNMAEASAFHRGKRLESGDGLSKATERLGHERSLRRWQRRTGRH